MSAAAKGLVFPVEVGVRAWEVDLGVPLFPGYGLTSRESPWPDGWNRCCCADADRRLVRVIAIEPVDGRRLGVLMDVAWRARLAT